MKKELYAEVRQLTLTHQGPWEDWRSLSKIESCSHCEGRWKKIAAVLDKIVDNAEAILEDRAAEEAERERIRQVIANLKDVPLRPRRP